MTAKQRLRLATVPMPLLTPQAPGQLSLTGEPVPGPGETQYSCGIPYCGQRAHEIGAYEAVKASEASE